MTVTVDEQLIAGRIAAALTRAGFGPEDAAAALGVSERAVYHWLAGTRRPRAQLLVALAELVGASPGWLMGRG